MTEDRFPAVILAGGQSTRMGGGDKGLKKLAGRRLIDHVISRIGPQVGAMALNANGMPARFADLGLPVLPDGIEGYVGPLAGVLAGMDWAAKLGATAVVSVAADTPFFPSDLVSRLPSARGPSGLALAASPDTSGKVWHHPTFGLWPVALRDDLDAALRGGLRKIVDWTDRHDAGIAVFNAARFDPFFNINTPEDMDAAERLAAK